jgi:hypothetical protein
MKNVVSFLLVFFLGAIAGVGIYYKTSGAAERARVATLEAELKARNDKLDKCTDALINLHVNAPQAPPTVEAGAK